jgi:small subunit ribosomal protein S20
MRLRPPSAGSQAGKRLIIARSSSILAVALTSMGPLTTLRGPTNQEPKRVANTKSAEKAARQAEKHRAHNVTLRSRMRTAIRQVIHAIAKGDKDAALSSYRAAVPMIDTLVSKRIIHRNQADRHKSRLAARVKALSR